MILIARSNRLFSRNLRAFLVVVFWRLSWGPVIFYLCFSSSLQAGTQSEERLMDSVRTSLRLEVNHSDPPVLVHLNVNAAHAFERWLTQTEARLEKQLQRQKVSTTPADILFLAAEPNRTSDVLPPELASSQLRREFLQTVWYESQRAGLEPSLVLGLIQVESGFRKFAISKAGARGFMQVMPFWTRELADGDVGILFKTQTNLRFGCVILRYYLNVEDGNLFLALGRYNGSRGQAPYPNAVLAAQIGWQ